MPHASQASLQSMSSSGSAMEVIVEGNDKWARVLQRLRAELGDAIYSSWFARLELVRVAGGCAILSVPTKFLKAWIQRHYSERICTALNAEFGDIASIDIDVRPTLRSPVRVDKGIPEVVAIDNGAPIKESLAPAPANATTGGDDGPFAGSPLDRRMTFENFLVGTSNQLAHAAAHRVGGAKAGDPVLFNPLFVHANVGLGKTHVIQAIAHLATSAGRRVIYLSAEKFMYGFVAALRAQNAGAFKEKMRAIDILIIDDIQFLQGKVIQQEFCHTLNALLDAGRQVVVASDRPPSDLESLDERVRSRLAGGFSVDIGPLDEELRGRILQSRIGIARQHHPDFDVPAAVLQYVTKSIQTNGRDLDGAINRLLAHVTLTGLPLTVETTEAAIRDLVRAREPKRVKIEDIQKLVANHYNVSRADILSSRRTAMVVRPRQIAMYLSKVLTLRSLPEIGRRFGGRDHTTVLHAVRKIDKLSADNRTLTEELELLKRMLTES